MCTFVVAVVIVLFWFCFFFFVVFLFLMSGLNNWIIAYENFLFRNKLVAHLGRGIRKRLTAFGKQQDTPQQSKQLDLIRFLVTLAFILEKQFTICLHIEEFQTSRQLAWLNSLRSETYSPRNTGAAALIMRGCSQGKESITVVLMNFNACRNFLSCGRPKAC